MAFICRARHQQELIYMTNLGKKIMEKKRYIISRVEVVMVLFEGYLCANTNEKGDYEIGRASCRERV